MPASRSEQERVAARRARALQLRAAGMPYQAIADELGHKTKAAAVQDVTRALQSRREDLDRQRALFVTLETERLDGLERAVQTVMRQAGSEGDRSLVLRAADRLLRIAERRAALLGLDETGKAKDDAGDPIGDAIDALFAEVRHEAPPRT